MKKPHLRPLTLIIAILALSLFVACGTGGEETNNAPVVKADTTAVATVTATATAAPRTGEKIDLLNVSYDPTRELYEQYSKIFSAYYLHKTGVEVTVKNSHGGSGSQARSVIDGLNADVVTLALAGDVNAVATRGFINSNWESRLGNHSSPYVSTIVFLVRKGNPKQIKTWDDLAKSGVGVITPNPKTSGGARWNFLAAWGWASLTPGGSEDKAKDLVGKIFANVTVLDSGARASTQTFVDKKIGDVLIAWENEALLTLRDAPNDFELVYPAHTILAEPSVAVVDKNVDAKKTRVAAEEFLKYLYTPESQDLIARNGYRPSNPEVLGRYKSKYPDFQRLYTIRDFTSWDAVQTKFFADGAIFDQIYKPR